MTSSLLLGPLMKEEQKPDCKSNVASEELNDLSLNQPKDYFPWNLLPKELQVKVLRHLTRSDLDKCRVLNRETFQLIRHHEKLMKRRIIEYLQIRIFETEKSFRLGMFARCSEVGITHIGNGRLTDNILWPISSCLLNVNCRVQKLSIGDTSFAAITSSIFLEFLRNAAPIHIDICGIHDCSHDNFSPEVLEFIVTRPKFELFYVQPLPFPIDDDIFAKLTASEFTIGATTRITADGIKSFVGGLASGKHEVVRGEIRIPFSLGSLQFPTPSNVKMSVFTEERNAVPYQYVVMTATTRRTAKLKT
uniref:Cyclin F-box domain containing protein n=1 Tax=Haemonchus contortus TaxID=6289 RepID=W6NUT0_HAECO